MAAAIDDPRTRAAVEAERSFLETSGGGCRAPIGALATIDGTHLDLLAAHASPDGSATTFGHRQGPVADARRIAVEMARELLPATRVERPLEAAGASDDRFARVLVTRAAEQSVPLVRALREAGLTPVLVPAIAIEFDPPGADVDRAAASLDGYRWVVATSANGAHAILRAAERVRTELGSPRWAAIGPTTRSALERDGVEVSFVPSDSRGAAMATELPISKGDRVLVVRGDLAGPGLADTLRTLGATVDDVVAYRTLEAPRTSRTLLRKAMEDGPIDAVVFTSGSTIRGLLSLAGPDGPDATTIPAVCIGPETAREAETAGFRVIAVAADRNDTSLATATADALTRQLQEIS